MTCKEKYYKLAQNMLDNKADIYLKWDSEKERYRISYLYEARDQWELTLFFNHPILAHLYYKNNDESWTAYYLHPEMMDVIIDVLRDRSWIEYLAEGIE